MQSRLHCRVEGSCTDQFVSRKVAVATLLHHRPQSRDLGKQEQREPRARELRTNGAEAPGTGPGQDRLPRETPGQAAAPSAPQLWMHQGWQGRCDSNSSCSSCTHRSICTLNMMNLYSISTKRCGFRHWCSASAGRG